MFCVATLHYAVSLDINQARRAKVPLHSRPSKEKQVDGRPKRIMTEWRAQADYVSTITTRMLLTLLVSTFAQG